MAHTQRRPTWLTLRLISHAIYGANLFLIILKFHSLSFLSLTHKDVFRVWPFFYLPLDLHPYLMVSIGAMHLAPVWALAEYYSKFPAIGRCQNQHLYLDWVGLVHHLSLSSIHSWPGFCSSFRAVTSHLLSLGTIFYRMKNNKWMHIIWHLFVLDGAVFMFYSILCFLVRNQWPNGHWIFLFDTTSSLLARFSYF